MFCGKCGANVEQGRPFLQRVRTAQCRDFAVGQARTASVVGAVPSAAAPAYSAPGSPSLPASAAQSNIGYAGFWLRLVAAIIDGIVISIPLMPVFFLIFIDIFRHAQDLQGRQDPAAFLAIMGPKIGLILFVSAIVSWLYWALCESSAWQATLGKKALGIIVTDLEGRRISFGRASGRFWAGRGRELYSVPRRYLFPGRLHLCRIHRQEASDSRHDRQLFRAAKAVTFGLTLRSEMYCSKCGTQLTNDTIFCSACGQATGVVAPIGIAAAAPSSSAPGLPGYAPAANAVPGTVARYTPRPARCYLCHRRMRDSGCGFSPTLSTTSCSA